MLLLPVLRCLPQSRLPAWPLPANSADGQRGTREQCLEEAQRALSRGESVLIDRTHVNPDQRRPFLRLAQQLGVQVGEEGVGAGWGQEPMPACGTCVAFAPQLL